MNPSSDLTALRKGINMITKTFTFDLLSARGIQVRATYEITSSEQRHIDAWIRDRQEEARVAQLLAESATHGTWERREETNG